MIRKLLVLAIMSVILYSCDNDNSPEPRNTWALFEFSTGAVDYRNVTFTALGDPDAESYSWDLGDGTTSTEQNPTHYYPVPGNYEVTVTVTKGEEQDVYTHTIAVVPDEDPSTFTEIASLTIGGEGAAEISAWDAVTQQLYVVNNEGDTRIDVIGLLDPSAPTLGSSISMSSYGAGVNSVAVSNGLLAVAVEANNKQDNGVVVVFNTIGLTEEAVINVGALPDMVTFTPDGSYILVANEGEPNDAYTDDPEGSVSVISATDFSVQTAGFGGFNSQEAELEKDGFRVFGPGATLAQDVEPEFITVSDDSKTAYVALQENNGLAVVDIASASVTDIIPLGTKDYSLAGNEIDPSDEDGKVEFRSVPAVGVFQPDAIAYFTTNGSGYIISANEGDSREYDGYVGEERVADVDLDPTAYPNASELQQDANLGRLKMMLSEGDTDGDGDYDLIHSYGARSFSIWSGAGDLVYDSGNELDREAEAAGIYADGRSDDKSIEPEGVAVGMVNGDPIAFIGLERVDAVAVYNVADPSSPEFLTMLTAGDAPEGILFIPKEETSNGRSLLVVSSEDDGSVKVYMTN